MTWPGALDLTCEILDLIYLMIYYIITFSWKPQLKAFVMPKTGA